jgi:hypothetical protein
MILKLMCIWLVFIQFYSSVRFSHFMESEPSLPWSQETATCPYQEPGKSSLCPRSQTKFFKMYINLTPSIFPCYLKWIPSPQVSPPKLCMHLSISQTFLMSRPSYPRFYCRNNIRIIQIVQIVVTLFINVSYSEAHRFKNFFVGILLGQVFF